MSYPIYNDCFYINPSGNIAASGYYVSHITQELANMFPYWTEIRSNSDSVGQQFMSPMARIFHDIEGKLSTSLNEKFISLAPVDEIDILYRMKIPSTISYLNNPAIECWTAPSGATPSGYPFPEPVGGMVNAIQVKEIVDLEDFYYDVLPTRTKTTMAVAYSDAVAETLGVNFPEVPSGVLDLRNKYVDQWKHEHNISWAHANEATARTFLKQDTMTMETYTSYSAGASGYAKGFTIYKDKIWWVASDNAGKYYLTISNLHPSPANTYLDTLAICDISNLPTAPSGVDVDEEGNIWILDSTRKYLYAVDLMYDYFLVDKDNRYIYFLEDYSDPGVFVKPA